MSKVKSLASDNNKSSLGGTGSVGGSKLSSGTGRVSGAGRTSESKARSVSRSVNGRKSSSDAGRTSNVRKSSSQRPSSESASRTSKSGRTSGSAKLSRAQSVQGSRGSSLAETGNAVRRGTSSKKGSEIKRDSDVKSGREVSRVRSSGVKKVSEIKNGSEVRKSSEIKKGSEVRGTSEVIEGAEDRAGSDVRGKSKVIGACEIPGGCDVRGKCKGRPRGNVRGKCSLRERSELGRNISAASQGPDGKGRCCAFRSPSEIAQTYNRLNPAGLCGCEKVFGRSEPPPGGIIEAWDLNEDPSASSADNWDGDEFGASGSLQIRESGGGRESRSVLIFKGSKPGPEIEDSRTSQSAPTTNLIDAGNWSTSCPTDSKIESTPTCKCESKPENSARTCSDNSSKDPPRKKPMQCKCPPSTRETSCKLCKIGQMTTECCHKCMIALGKKLLRASQDGRCTEVRKLLEEGADPNFTYDSDWTALQRASAKGFPEVVAELLKNGANVNAKVGGFTALHLAAYNDRTGRCAFQLINAGADLESVNKFGRTPLHYASESANACAVRELLAAGALRTVKDNLGWTPIDVGRTAEVRRILHQLP